MINKITFATVSASAIILVAPLLASAAILSVQLAPGATGSDVSALQIFLAKDSSIYPEGLVTGFYGPLTEAAVRRYQAQFGIAVVGRVGPITLASINGTSGTGGSDDVNASVTTSISVWASSHSATIGWMSSEPVFGRALYGTGQNFVYAASPSIQSATGFNTSQVLAINGLMPNTRYYYILESVDVAGNITWTIGRSFVTTQ